MRTLKYLAVILIFSTAIAQPPGHGMGPGDDGGPLREKVRQKIKTIKIWRLTEAVGLTPEQSEKFFPLYNRHEDLMENLEIEQRERLNRIEQLTADPKSSDKEIEDAIAGIKDIFLRRMELKESFMAEISGVLSTRQKGQLLVFEETFRRDMQDIIREIRREMGGGPGRGKRQ